MQPTSCKLQPLCLKPENLKKETLYENYSQKIFKRTVSSVTSCAVAYSGPCHTSKMEFFVKIVNRFHPLTIFVKSFISEAGLGSAYTFGSTGNHSISLLLSPFVRSGLNNWLPLNHSSIATCTCSIRTESLATL